MMKRFLVSLAFIAFAISAAAAQLPAVLKAEPDGSVQLGNIGMYVIHIGEQWAGSMQRSLNPDEKTKIGPDRIFVSGSFPAANSSDNFTFVEELLPTEAEKVSCSWRITAPQDVICRALAVSFDIPAGTAGTGITVDGTKVVLPEQTRGIGLFRKGGATEIVITPAEGQAIRLVGKFDAAIQDNRKFSQNTFSVRLSPVGMPQKLRDWKLDFQLELLPQNK